MATGRVPTTANSPLTAKGDLFTYSTAPARLAVGLDGEQIVADSSTATGLRWQEPKVQQPVLNSAFQIWQRGTSSTATGYGSADRWYQARGAATASWSQVTSSLPTGFQYALKVQRTAGQTSSDGISISQVLETVNSIPFAGKTVTLSFYAKAGANYSPTSSALAVRGYTGTGTDQAAGNFGGWTGYAEPVSGSATLTTSWQRFSFTGTIASTATQIGMVFYLFGSGTAGADDSFQITGVQLEAGSVATAFQTATGTIQGELAACQRYYWRNTASPSVAAMTSVGYVESATNANLNLLMPVEMRVAPTSVEFSSLRAYDGSALNAVTNVTLAGAVTPKVANLVCTTTGLTTGRAVSILAASSGTPYIGISAEL